MKKNATMITINNIKGDINRSLIHIIKKESHVRKLCQYKAVRLEIF